MAEVSSKQSRGAVCLFFVMLEMWVLPLSSSESVIDKLGLLGTCWRIV